MQETLTSLLENHKQKLYRTAQALIGCAKFPALTFVSVKYSHRGSNGIAWYEINRTENGALDSAVMYPESHLARFTF
jgi:hypothetical protein